MLSGAGQGGEGLVSSTTARPRSRPGSSSLCCRRLTQPLPALLTLGHPAACCRTWVPHGRWQKSTSCSRAAE